MNCVYFNGIKNFKSKNRRCRNCIFYMPSITYRNTNYCKIKAVKKNIKNISINNNTIKYIDSNRNNNKKCSY